MRFVSVTVECRPVLFIRENDPVFKGLGLGTVGVLSPSLFFVCVFLLTVPVLDVVVAMRPKQHARE